MDGLALVPYHPAELSRVEPSIDSSCKVPNHCTKRSNSRCTSSFQVSTLSILRMCSGQVSIQRTEKSITPFDRRSCDVTSHKV